jgi:hypothetical protein
MGEFSFRRRAPARRGVAHPRRVLVAEDETLPDRTGGSMVIARMIAHLGRSEDHADDRRGNTAPITCTRGDTRNVRHEAAANQRVQVPSG